MKGKTVKLNNIFNWFVIGLSFGMGFELASWIIDYILQTIGFPLG